MFTDYVIKDISLADFGDKEIELAKNEMPGLVALLDEYKNQKPLYGAKIVGCLHMTIQTAVLIETLVELGAQVRWASSNIFQLKTTQQQLLPERKYLFLHSRMRVLRNIGNSWTEYFNGKIVVQI